MNTIKLTPGQSSRKGLHKALLPVLNFLLAVILGLGALTLSCSEPPTATPTAQELLTPVGTPTAQALLTPVGTPVPQVVGQIPEPPRADLASLAQRLRLKSTAPIPRLVNPTPPTYTLGERRGFWFLNMERNQYFSAAATLRQITPHAYFYIQEGIDVEQEALERSAAEFEERIYPAVTRYFGQVRSPGIDNDPRIAVLNATLPGVLGYFSEVDSFPKVVHSYSNERNAIYMNIALAKIGTTLYHAVLAHELQHAVHSNLDPYEQGWVNEGLAELAIDLAGYGAGVPRAFLNAPDFQLNNLGEKLDYGAAYLFMKYLMEHYGGPEALKDLVAEPARGIRGINAFLAKRGYKVSFLDLFKDWVVANYVNLREGGPYSYSNPNIRMYALPGIIDFKPHRSRVYQYGAKYFYFKPPSTEDFLVNFKGTSTVKVLPNEPRSGTRQWWSNRGDLIDSTLTREFDLSGLKSATLNFWLWYDTEKNYDYAYVMVSTDNGVTWNILAGKHTTEENPVGNSYGPAYTGKSGGGKEPVWVNESIDLSPYVGGKVLLRFEYVTDAAVTQEGFSIDDISIPELGFIDDAESDAGWRAEGFVRTDNQLKQRFVVRLIETGPGVAVRDMALDGEQKGTLAVKGLGNEVGRAVLVVAGATEGTLQSAPFEISLQAASP